MALTPLGSSSQAFPPGHVLTRRSVTLETNQFVVRIPATDAPTDRPILHILAVLPYSNASADNVHIDQDGLTGTYVTRWKAAAATLQVFPGAGLELDSEVGDVEVVFFCNGASNGVLTVMYWWGPRLSQETLVDAST